MKSVLPGAILWKVLLRQSDNTDIERARTVFPSSKAENILIAFSPRTPTISFESPGLNKTI